MLVQGVMQRCIRCPWQLSVGPVCLCRTRPSLQWTPLWQRVALYICRALAPQWKDTCSNQKIRLFQPHFKPGKKKSNQNCGEKKKNLFKASYFPTISYHKEKKENLLPSYNAISICPVYDREPQHLPLWENKRTEFTQRQHTILDCTCPKEKEKKKNLEVLCENTRLVKYRLVAGFVLQFFNKESKYARRLLFYSLIVDRT